MDPSSGIAVAAYGRAGGRVKTRRCYIAPTGTLRIHRVGSMTERRHGSERGRSGFGRLREAWREFAYGMLGYEFSQHAREMRNSLETVFMVTTHGDMIGLPIIPPYYSLRLLPYVAPEIETWKKRVLREREFTEDHDTHLHGL
jgi:hypothetical protein